MTSKAYNSKFTEMAKSHPLIPPQVIKELHAGAKNAAISEGLKMREKPAEGDIGHEEAETPDEEAMEQPESPDEPEEAEGTDESDLEEAFEKDCGFAYPQENDAESWAAWDEAHSGSKGGSKGKERPADKIMREHANKVRDEKRKAEKAKQAMLKGHKVQKDSEDDGFAYKENANWIAGAIKHPGALREELGAKEGKNIPAKKLSAAIKKGKKEDATPHEKLTAKRAQLAKTLSKMHK